MHSHRVPWFVSNALSGAHIQAIDMEELAIQDDPQGNPAAVEDVALSPDGRRLAVGLSNGLLHVCSNISIQRLFIVAFPPLPNGRLLILKKYADHNLAFVKIFLQHWLLHKSVDLEW